MKIGANGDISLAVLANGDIQVSLIDNEVDSSQSIVVAVHPAVVQAALVQLAGGGAFATSAIGFLMSSIPAIVAAIPQS